MKTLPRFILSAACLLALPAHASEPPAAPAPLTLMAQAGRSADTGVGGLGVRLAPFWTRTRGALAFSAHPEVQVNRHFWRHPGGAGPSSLWQGGVAAMLRVAWGHGPLRPYLELGLGVNYLSRAALGNDRYGSQLHFGEHFGIGLEAGRVFAGWRVSHYSNGGLRPPNNGVDARQIVLGVRF